MRVFCVLENSLIQMLEYRAKMAHTMLLNRDDCLTVYVFLTTPDDYVIFGGSGRGYRATSFLCSAYRHGNQAVAWLF